MAVESSVDATEPTSSSGDAFLSADYSFFLFADAKREKRTRILRGVAPSSVAVRGCALAVRAWLALGDATLEMERERRHDSVRRT